ncbi:hypothetical protein GBAR_LOCUS5158 [Geodia barretti]|nr:hypothetical protein GBAR_LOCUS5158 [Geodia barretti]
MYLFKPPADEVGCVSVGESVITMDTVSHMTVTGFKVGCTRQTAITATSVSYVELANMSVVHSGDRGVYLSGYNSTVRNITVEGNGCGGIGMTGGDQLSLTRGNNLLTQCLVTDWSRWKRTYQPGISWGGVGNNFTNNRLSNAPHAGILGGGNDCLFEFNSLSDLCYEVTDSGAFYTGRSWIDRGNVIRHSTFTNIATTEKVYLGSPSVQAIYLDDQMSGYMIYNNTFINCHAGSFIGGGRRNQVLNNTYYNCSLAVHVDNRGMTWQADECKEGGPFDQQLQSVHYQSPPWSVHYPQLVHIFQDHPCVPVYNTVEDNQYCHGEFIDVTAEETREWLDTVANNTIHC